MSHWGFSNNLYERLSPQVLRFLWIPVGWESFWLLIKLVGWDRKRSQQELSGTGSTLRKGCQEHRIKITVLPRDHQHCKVAGLKESWDHVRFHQSWNFKLVSKKLQTWEGKTMVPVKEATVDAASISSIWTVFSVFFIERRAKNFLKTFLSGKEGFALLPADWFQ